MQNFLGDTFLPHPGYHLLSDEKERLNNVICKYTLVSLTQLKYAASFAHCYLSWDRYKLSQIQSGPFWIIINSTLFGDYKTVLW